MAFPSAPPGGGPDAGPKDSLQIRTREEFGLLFNSLGLLGHGAEIGVQAGHFASILRSTWKGRPLHLIDRWRHDSQYLDLANVSDREHNRLYRSVIQRFAGDDGVLVYRLDSLCAARQFEDCSFDWVYLDADHSYQGCKADLHAWYPKVRSGGVLAGHDFVDGTFLGGHYGVKSAVEEFVRDRRLSLYLTQEAWKSWYFVKPDTPDGLHEHRETPHERGLGTQNGRPGDDALPSPEAAPRPLNSRGSRKLRLYRLIWRTVWRMRDLRDRWSG